MCTRLTVYLEAEVLILTSEHCENCIVILGANLLLALSSIFITSLMLSSGRKMTYLIERYQYKVHILYVTA